MHQRLPTMQSLICFVAVSKHLSHTDAAKELFMTQSAVSRQIQSLEALLDVQLFNRTRYGVELTQAGKQYAEQIMPHLMGLEKCTANLISHKGLGGTLKIGVVPTFATRWLLPKLPNLSNLYPEITLQIETNTKPFLFHDTPFDAAIFTGTDEQIKHWPAINAHFLMKESLLPVCSPKLIKRLFPNIISCHKHFCSLSTKQLLKIPLLQQTTRPNIWQEWFHANNIDHPNPLDGQRQELFSMLVTAALHEMGMALIPQMFIDAEINRGDLLVCSNKPFDSGRAYYVVHSAQTHSALVDKFVRWLLSHCNEPDNH